MAKSEEEKAAEKAKKDAAKAAAEFTKLNAQLVELHLAPPGENETNEEIAARIKAAKDAAKAAGSTKPRGTDPIVVKYRDHEGNPTERTFSKDVHGDNFADLAEEFKKTNEKKLITE